MRALTMRATFFLILLACNAWMTLCLPVQHDGQSSMASTTSLASNRIADDLKTLIHRSDSNLKWHGDEMSELPDGTQTGVEGNRIRITSHWTERYQKTLRRMWTFYLLHYPSKPQNSPLKKSNTLLDMTTERNFSSSSSNLVHAATNAFRGKSVAEQFMLNVSRIDLVIFYHEFSPEIIGIAIFLLVPAAVLAVEGMDMLREWWTPERFPQRGRGRVRLVGPERQLSVLSAWEREKIVQQQSQKWWTHRRRS
jgi:hypothetical protein